MDSIRTLLHVGIVLALTGPITDQQIAALESETIAIWRTYGVEITWFDANADCASDETGAPPVVDRIVWLVTEAPGTAGDALGNVRFRAGIPGDTIHLRYGLLSRLVLDSTLSGWSIGLLPAPVRDRLLGRAMGRVVAHELGHLLLVLRSHDRTGLMRPTFMANDLLAVGREHMRLSKTYESLLHERLNRTISP